MKFEIIDGDLKIAACKIGDLTAELAESILKQWEPGATLHTLTPFYSYGEARSMERLGDHQQRTPGL